MDSEGEYEGGKIEHFDEAVEAAMLAAKIARFRSDPYFYDPARALRPLLKPLPFDWLEVLGKSDRWLLGGQIGLISS